MWGVNKFHGRGSKRDESWCFYPSGNKSAPHIPLVSFGPVPSLSFSFFPSSKLASPPFPVASTLLLERETQRTEIRVAMAAKSENRIKSYREKWRSVLSFPSIA